MGSQPSTALPKEPPAFPPGGEEDRISALPDELLHIILSRLRSAAAAARTSVLSRRWRGVWAHMPELVLGGRAAFATPPSALLDSIDAALDSFIAPTLRSLNIQVSGVHRRDVPAHRISPWLRFASQRLTGKLRLQLAQIDNQWFGHNKEELALPICERATEIYIDLYLLADFFLRPPATGSFSALTNLQISSTRMDGGELGRLVSSVQSPCLRELRVYVLKLEPIRDISISSESLEYLYYHASKTGKLEVNAPMLKVIDVSKAAEAFIAAPKLENVKWLGPYDPRSHQFVVAGRHLRSLSIMHSTCSSTPTSSTRLMKRFDTIGELAVFLSLGKEIAEYMSFLEEVDSPPICETLFVSLWTSNLDRGHDFAPIMLHLLRRSICIRKLILRQRTPSEELSHRWFLRHRGVLSQGG